MVRGYFTNDTDKTVDRINSFSAKVRLLRHDEWKEYASATFDAFDVHIRPGKTLVHTFRIREVEPRKFEKWNVRTNFSYHWHGHHHDEYHHHHED